MRRLMLSMAVLLAVLGFAVVQASGGQGARRPTVALASPPVPQGLVRALARSLHPSRSVRAVKLPPGASIVPPPCEISGSGCSIHPCVLFVSPQAPSAYLPGAIAPRVQKCLRRSSAAPVAARD